MQSRKLPRFLSQDPDCMSGEVCFAGTRVPVYLLFDYLRGGRGVEDFKASYPTVPVEYVDNALCAARDALAGPEPELPEMDAHAMERRLAMGQ